MRLEPTGISQRSELAVLALSIVLSLILIVLPGESRIRIADRLGRVLTSPYIATRNFLDDVVTLRSENTRLQRELFNRELENGASRRSRSDMERKTGCALEKGFGGVLAPCRVTMRQRSRFATMVKIVSARSLPWHSWLPVVNRAGMLGRIRTVLSPTEAWVELMTAPDFALGVEFERTGLLGVLQPRGDRFVITMVGRDEDIRSGDLVMTSGITERKEGGGRLSHGATAPRGIPVGTVSTVRTPNDQVFKEIMVEPFASCDRNETVFVLLMAMDEDSPESGGP